MDELACFMLTQQEALRLIEEHVSGVKKKRHMIATSAIMKELAKRLGMDEYKWELVGLLHDLDYDMIGGDMRKHGLVAAEMMQGKLPEECLHAIRSHDYRTGVKPESMLDKALIAVDCVWILMVRVAFLNSRGRIDGVDLDALKNLFEDKSFPAFLKSSIMLCRDFGLTLEDFLKMALEATPSDLTISEDDL